MYGFTDEYSSCIYLILMLKRRLLWANDCAGAISVAPIQKRIPQPSTNKISDLYPSLFSSLDLAYRMIKKTSKKKAVEREVIAPVLQQALKNSLTSGSFIDIKIYAFSRRGHGGEANDPRPLYMNSQVLAKVPHFNRSWFSHSLDDIHSYK